MSLVDTEPASATRAFGLRLGLWYATLFVLGSILIVLLTYVLTSSTPAAA